MRLLSVIILLSCSFQLSAQRGINILSTLDSLNYTDKLPKELLSTKSLVLVKVPPKRTSPEVRGDWGKPGEVLQTGFKKGGIDAVSYYYIDDVFSGPEVVSAFAEKFAERQLQNVIFIIEEAGQYKVVITEITDKDNLITAGQDAWRIEGDNLETMANTIYLKAANSGQDRSNLLVIDVPIYGEMAHAINARRGEYFDVNFSSETLAIPAFADTSQINKVMSKYPYKYEIVDPTKTEKELRSDGHQYILYYVHTIGKHVKEILEYPTTNTETAYISEVTAGNNNKAKVVSINVNTPVYKFYIKHIYSENVFLGTKWDAAPTWWEALDNYVTNLKNQLVD